MTELSWPSSLPLPLRDNYGLEPRDPIIRTDMESGAARQRRQFTDVPTRFPVQWSFSDWQFAQFQSWVKHKADDGAVWFAIDLVSGLGLSSHEARFAGRSGAPYQASKSGPGRWRVSTSLEVRSAPVMTEEILDVVLVNDPDALIAAIGGLTALVTATLPADMGAD